MTSPVSFSGEGPPETVLPPDHPEVLDALAEAGRDAGAVAQIVADHPRSLTGWATLGELTEATADGGIAPILEAYAYFRIGYHRGLDTLRQNGWRGSGYVRWEHPTNRGFLRCLDGLGRMAAAIGEDDERDRCDQFLRQLDPSWPPSQR